VGALAHMEEGVELLGEPERPLGAVREHNRLALVDNVWSTRHMYNNNNGARHAHLPSASCEAMTAASDATSGSTAAAPHGICELGTSGVGARAVAAAARTPEHVPSRRGAVVGAEGGVCSRELRRQQDGLARLVGTDGRRREHRGRPRVGESDDDLRRVEAHPLRGDVDVPGDVPEIHVPVGRAGSPRVR
jgi:hypothetical protein